MSRGEPGETIAAPELLPVQRWPLTQELKQLAIEPTLGWIAGLRERWQPGEERATCALRSFCARVSVYEEQRNRPDLAGTSSLSAHLRFGELSPRQAWHAARGAAGLQAEPWLRQLAWRDFGHHLLQAYPQTVEHPMRPEFAAFPWRQDDTALRQWQRGETGYPLVDAGMRQLWRTGWMHNRVRMVVASFLVKDLMTVCPGLEVFGVDISDYAVRNCEPEVVGRLHVGSCENMPFPDNSFGSTLVWGLTQPSIVEAIDDILRVTKENGLIVVGQSRYFADIIKDRLKRVASPVEEIDVFRNNCS